MNIPESGIRAAVDAWDKKMGSLYGPDRYEELAGDVWVILNAAAPHLIAEATAAAKSNHEHIIEGGDGYSAGFHYALYCLTGGSL